jgi:hypothetical protein
MVKMDFGQVSGAVAGRSVRLDYIDALKGLAMMMVIVGHVFVFCGLGSDNVIIKHIVLLNMPLFFMLNGLVVNVLPPPHDGGGSQRRHCRGAQGRCRSARPEGLAAAGAVFRVGRTDGNEQGLQLRRLDVAIL